MNDRKPATRDWQDIIGGALLAALGLFVAIYAKRYEFGRLSQMGPGFFPLLLGAALAMLGLMIAVPAFFRTGTWPQVRWRVGVLIAGSVVFFAATLEPLGLAASSFLSVCVSSLADREMTWFGRTKLAAAISLIACAVFILGLKMPLAVFPKGF